MLRPTIPRNFGFPFVGNATLEALPPKVSPRSQAEPGNATLEALPPKVATLVIQLSVELVHAISNLSIFGVFPDCF
jgi:hypothetical protein